MKQEFFEELKEKAEKMMSRDGSHSFDHVERVYNLSMKIAKEEDIDLDILKAAVILHDIGRKKENEKVIECHAEGGANMAREILLETDFPKEKIQSVMHCIKVHRFSKGLKAESKEAEILQDADRLDALGAICIARVFAYNGYKGNPIYDPNIKPEKDYHGQENTAINHFYEKILKIKPEIFQTEKAREIAKERYNFIKIFLDRFKKEWEGEI